MFSAVLSKVFLGGLFLFFLQGCCSRQHPSVSPDNTSDVNVNISCLIINLKYVFCNWTNSHKQERNYIFSSIFGRSESYQDCQEYHRENGQNIGCRIPLQNQDQRFSPFYTKLSSGRHWSIFKNYTNLKERVKLNPPYNISLNLSGSDDEICLRWVNSGKVQCVVNMVQYQRGLEEWKLTEESSSPYCVSPVSNGVTYTFQVRSTVREFCGASNFWSDWSDPVEWSNNTGADWGQQSLYWWHVLCAVIGVLVLTTLSALLYYFERIKVILIPAVPDPSKRLQDLFQKYNGNVDSWVHISRELKEAFEPDYTESHCVVCEPSPDVDDKSGNGPLEQPCT